MNSEPLDTDFYKACEQKAKDIFASDTQRLVKALKRILDNDPEWKFDAENPYHSLAQGIFITCKNF